MICLHVFVILLLDCQLVYINVLLKATLSQSDGTGSCVIVKIENVHDFDDAMTNFSICHCLEDLDLAEFTKHCDVMKEEITNPHFFDSLKFLCKRAVVPIENAFKERHIIDCAYKDLNTTLIVPASGNDTNYNSTELTELNDVSNATETINNSTDTFSKKGAIINTNETNVDTAENLKDINSTIDTDFALVNNTDTVRKNWTIDDDIDNNTHVIDNSVSNNTHAIDDSVSNNTQAIDDNVSNDTQAIDDNVANNTRTIDDVVLNNTSTNDVLQVNNVTSTTLNISNITTTSTTESANKDDVKSITQIIDNSTSSKYEDTSVEEAKYSSSLSTILCTVIVSFAAGVLVAIAVKVAYNRYHSRAFVLPPEQAT